jgi:hypothetical protein
VGSGVDGWTSFKSDYVNQWALTTDGDIHVTARNSSKSVTFSGLPKPSFCGKFACGLANDLHTILPRIPFIGAVTALDGCFLISELIEMNVDVGRRLDNSLFDMCIEFEAWTLVLWSGEYALAMADTR